jgi:hypothetical protein
LDNFLQKDGYLSINGYKWGFWWDIPYINATSHVLEDKPSNNGSWDTKQHLLGELWTIMWRFKIKHWRVDQ